MKLPRKWQMVMEENSEYKFNKVLDENEKKKCLIFIKKKNQRNFLANPMYVLFITFFLPLSFERQPCKAIIINIC